MPQDKLQQLMIQRPPQIDGERDYAVRETPSLSDDVLRALAVAAGIEEQRPGDAAGAIGGMAGLLPLGKLVKFFKKLPAKPGMPQLPQNVKLPHEFHQMPETGILHDLPQAEIDKAIDLAKPRPHLERKPNLPDKIGSDEYWKTIPITDEYVSPPTTKRKQPAPGEFNPKSWSDLVEKANSSAAPTRFISKDYRTNGTYAHNQPGLDEDFIFDSNKLDADIEAQHAMMQKDLSSDIPMTPMVIRNNLKLAYATQRPLKVDTPIVSYHPDLNVRDVEAKTKMFNDALTSTPRPAEDYVNSLHFRPGDGGLFEDANKRIYVGGEQSPANTRKTIGHEIQHAVDAVHDRNVFKGYPITLGSLGDVPKYWNHPSEVRARAAGELFNFGKEGKQTGQQLLPADFLRDMALGIEELNGGRMHDMLKARKFYDTPYQRQPFDRKLPF